jgi:hypothetical protein
VSRKISHAPIFSLCEPPVFESDVWLNKSIIFEVLPALLAALEEGEEDQCVSLGCVLHLEQETERGRGAVPQDFHLPRARGTSAVLQVAQVCPMRAGMAGTPVRS